MLFELRIQKSIVKLPVPGLSGVGHAVAHMNEGWLLLGVALEIVSCLGYVLVFLQVFDRAPTWRHGLHRKLGTHPDLLDRCH